MRYYVSQFIFDYFFILKFKLSKYQIIHLIQSQLNKSIIGLLICILATFVRVLCIICNPFICILCLKLPRVFLICYYKTFKICLRIIIYFEKKFNTNTLNSISIEFACTFYNSNYGCVSFFFWDRNVKLKSEQNFFLGGGCPSTK